MSSNKQLSNIVHASLNNKTVLYTSTNNLYYNFLSKKSEYNIISAYNQPIIGIINDNVIEYSNKIDQLSIDNHVYSIILFHEYPPEALKKEDRYLLYQKIKYHYKVFFSDKLYNKWSLPKDAFTFVNPYGVDPKEYNDIREKNIIIFNLSNNPVIENIYQNLKSQFTSIDICRSISNLDDVSSTISDYKIAICIGDPYNSIYCAANGCCVLSNTPIDPNINTIFQVENILNISNQINNILQNFDSLKDQIKNNVVNICTKYPQHEHIKIMDNIFKQLTFRPFIYEA